MNDNELHELTEAYNRSFDNGDYESALKYEKRILKIQMAILPTDSPDIALAHYCIGMSYFELGQYKKALRHYIFAQKIEEKSLLPNDPDKAMTYDGIGVTYEKLGLYKKALANHKLALDIEKQTLSPDSLIIATTYDNMGVVYEKLGQYMEALKYHTRSLEIEERCLPLDSLDIATTCNNMGVVYGDLGQYENALIYLKRALEIKEKTLQPDSADTAITYDNIGVMYEKMGQYNEALKHHKRALEIKEMELLTDNADIFITYDNIGSCYGDLGQYSEAIKYYKYALKIAQKNLSFNHPAIGTIYDNLGVVYSDLGQYEEALGYHRDALKIREKILSYNSPDIAISYDNIGTVYGDLGQYSEAKKYHERALEIKKKNLPPNSSDIAISHSNLGLVYDELGQYEDAKKHHEEALRIRIKSLLPDSPDIASSYVNLGAVYGDLGKYEEALIHHNYAIKIQEKVLPQDSPDIATTYNNMGVIYSGLNQYNEALKYHTKALEIRTKVLSPDSFDVALSNFNISYVSFQQGSVEKTIEYVKKLTSLLPSIYLNIMKIISDKIRISQLRSLYTHIYLVHSVVWMYPGRIKENSLYDILLKSKDISAESEFAILAYLPDRYPEHTDKIMQLRDKRAYQQSLMMNNPENAKAINNVDKEIQILEHDLVPYIREFDFKRYMVNMNARTVLDNLPVGTALLEFGWFYYTKPSIDMRIDIKSGGRYYVHLLRNGKITLCYLEAEEPIHKEINEVLRKITAADEKERPLLFDADEELNDLYKLLITPLEDNLQNIEHLYIAPDGELYKLPFELLLDEEGKRLSDKFAISYISSGRDLVRHEKRNKPIQEYKRVAILADPLYDLPDDTGLGKIYHNYDSRHLILKSRQSRDINKLDGFKPLQFAMMEANSLDKIFNGFKDKRYQLAAKKYTLNEINSPDIIHIVTHGFAYEKQVISESNLKKSCIPHRMSEDPMVRSGLVFSGVNNWLKSNKKRLLEEFGDGILNAKEVMSLNLLQTDLLVLSACQTALGEVKNGEGIQGLRRAFELAGVRSIICTLWEVSDESCAILMEKFYINLFEKGMNKLQALSYAKEQVENMTYRQAIEYYNENGFTDKANILLRECKYLVRMLDERIYKHPYFWAGYILQGDIN